MCQILKNWNRWPRWGLLTVVCYVVTAVSLWLMFPYRADVTIVLPEPLQRCDWVRLSGDGSTVVTALFAGNWHQASYSIWDSHTGTLRSRFVATGNWFGDRSSTSNDGLRMALILDRTDEKAKDSDGQSVLVIDTNSGRETGRYDIGDDCFPVFSPDLKSLAYRTNFGGTRGETSPGVVLFDLGREVQRFTIKGELLAFSYDSKLIATLDAPNPMAVRIWDIGLQKEVMKLRLPEIPGIRLPRGAYDSLGNSFSNDAKRFGMLWYTGIGCAKPGDPFVLRFAHPVLDLVDPATETEIKAAAPTMSKDQLVDKTEKQPEAEPLPEQEGPSVLACVWDVESGELVDHKLHSEERSTDFSQHSWEGCYLLERPAVAGRERLLDPSTANERLVVKADGEAESRNRNYCNDPSQFDRIRSSGDGGVVIVTDLESEGERPDALSSRLLNLLLKGTWSEGWPRGILRLYDAREKRCMGELIGESFAGISHDGRVLVTSQDNGSTLNIWSMPLQRSWFLILSVPLFPVGFLVILRFATLRRHLAT